MTTSPKDHGRHSTSSTWSILSASTSNYPTATIGGGIAVRELIDRILWMRRFKGNAVYPVVQLGHAVR